MRPRHSRRSGDVVVGLTDADRGAKILASSWLSVVGQSGPGSPGWKLSGNERVYYPDWRAARCLRGTGAVMLAPPDDATMLSTLSVLLFSATAPPPVVVSVDTSGGVAALGAPAARKLRASLVVRLVEEGYVVVPEAREAQVEVALRPSGDGWSVAAGAIEYHIAPGRPPIVELEILHRATMAVQAAERTVAKREPMPHAVAIEIAASSDDATVKGLHEELASELLKAGLPLSPVSASHDRTIRVVALGDEIDVFAVGESAEHREPTSKIHRRDAESEVIDAAGRAVAALSASQAPPDAPQRIAEQPGAAAQETRDRAPAQAPSDGATTPTHWTFAAGAGVGVMMRAGGTDPRVEASMHGTRESIGLRLEGDVAPSSSLGGALAITEWSLKVGPRWQRAFGRKTALGIALVGGLAVHHFRYTDSDSGSLLGGAFALPVDFAYRMSSWVTLTLSAAPALSFPQREHDVLGSVGWNRSSQSLAITAGVRVLP